MIGFEHYNMSRKELKEKVFISRQINGPKNSFFPFKIRFKSVLLAFLVLSFTSCKNSAWYPNSYIRKTNKLKHYGQYYKAADTVQLGKLHLCYSFIRSRSQAVGYLEIEPSEVVDSLLVSYSRQFEDFNVTESAISIDNSMCLFDSKESIISLHQNTYSKDKNSVKLYCQLSLNLASQRNLEGGGGLEVTEDMGNDKHLLEYYLITAIAQGESILYVDNRIHWTEVFSERGEEINYTVPETVIDSLVGLSLEEYFKRVSD